MQFHNLRLIGRGGFGQVYRATAVPPFKGDFALKRQVLDVDSKDLKDSKDVQQYLLKQRCKVDGLLQEAKVYCSPTLNKSHLHLALLCDVAYVTHTDTDGTSIKEPLLAMEWANAQPHNTLHAWMQGNPVSEQGIEERLSFAIQIFSGLVELHYGGHDATLARDRNLPRFVHQDLKPQNMLLFGHGANGSGPLRLALTDFGLSTCLNGTESEATYRGGTLFYKAPEQWLGMHARTPDRDVWAAGLVVAELFAGASTKKALKQYMDFCKHVLPKRQRGCAETLKEFYYHGNSISRAVQLDGIQAPETPLSRVQQAVAPLLLGSLNMSVEFGGAMLAGPGRWTSLKCEETLKQTWTSLSFQPPWERHYQTLPQPKPTPLQGYGHHALANFFLEYIEGGMLEMMLRRSERLLAKVDLQDKPTVEEEIRRLQSRLQQTLAKMKWQREKANQEAFNAVGARPTHSPDLEQV